MVTGLTTIKWGTDDAVPVFKIPLPCDKGAYSLHVDRIRWCLNDADAGDKVYHVRVYGIDCTGTATLYDAAYGGGAAPGVDSISIIVANQDMSGYYEVWVALFTQTGTNDDLEMREITARCWYE
jgi:hypothetical protein